jgi:hypothetical protein
VPAHAPIGHRFTRRTRLAVALVSARPVPSRRRLPSKYRA